MRHLVMGAAAMVAMAAAAPAFAAANLIQNGNFDQTYVAPGGTANASTPSEIGLNGYGVTGWTSGTDSGGNLGYNFIFNTALGGSAGYTSVSQYGSPATIQLYTSGTSGNGGCSVADCGAKAAPASLASPVPADPTTGINNVLAADGAFQVGAISQTLSNLVVGTDYTLTFYWAAGQQAGFTGQTTENWAVTFGTQTQSTPTVTTPSKGFTPWSLATMTFRATTAQQTLSFLAAGTPNGQPPFSLLDGVSLVAAPEPATWAVMLVGLGAAGAFTTLRRRQRRLPIAAA